MKKKITLKRFFHRDKWRYLLIFGYDGELISLAKKIKGAAFSITNKGWYADDDEETLKQILTVFRDKADIDISAIVSGEKEPENKSSTSGKKSEEQYLPENFFLQDEFTMPVTKEEKEEESENNIKEGKGEENINVKVKEENKTISGTARYGAVEFQISQDDERFSVKFTGKYSGEWIEELKSYGKCYYDNIRREWLLKWSRLTVDSLSDYFSSRGVEVRVNRQKPPEEIKESRRNFGDEIRLRELGPEGYEALDLLKNHLTEDRYSVRTVESYLALLELFLKFFNNKGPYDITQNEVSDFMNDFIIRNGFSSSYQNQMVSAIKMFYEISGKGRVLPQNLERPRRRRSLPKVFSKEEISRILNSTKNNKHKLLLWMIYSCGLRRSEVTNIRLGDLDRKRSLLNIREGKGGVDRIIPVSDKVWIKIDEYIEGYRPVYYLFEGQGGNKYSVESVYNVFKQALRNAGIKKEVGVHSLRHSYATHLHENGLDIRYIQELLGHRSTRTTEIYTHVSRRNLLQVRSPIDDLDVR